ncbi:hypothetical protein FDECE_3582 [Fusarium decemcellulare]|nr:hypothetical protein FDECE_3582 [Fusarium decemcellulare]
MVAPVAALLGLPVEILQAVCVELCPYCTPNTGAENARIPGDAPQRRRAVASLARACHVLNRVTTPCIYHEFVDEEGGNWNRVIGFLRTINQRSDLAALVRHLSLNQYTTHPGKHWTFIRNEAKRRGFILPYRNPPNVVDRRSNGLLVDLCLSLVPNVETLDLVVWPRSEYGKFMPPSTNLALKECRLAWDSDGAEILRLGEFATFFERTPHLESLEIEMCYYAARGLALGNLKRLKLKDSVIKLNDLRNLATGCSKLETFIFHNNLSYEQAPIEAEHFLPKNIPLGLGPCKDTLRHLEIQCNWEPFASLSPGHFVTSLKEFTTLETLILDVDCLCFGSTDDWEQSTDTVPKSLIIKLLPSSIKTVVIDGDRTSLYEPILALANKVKKGFFTQLKDFKVTGYHPNYPPFPFGRVKNTMAESGVSFEAYHESAFISG